MKCLKRLLQGCICAATAISLTSGIAFAAESKERTTTSVAKVGDTYYDSLAEAVNAIETEGTIELVKDAEVNTVINVSEENRSRWSWGIIRSPRAQSAAAERSFVIMVR